LFYAHRPTIASDPPNESNTSGEAWIENERKAIDDYKHGSPGITENLECHRHLLVYTTILTETLQWVIDNDKRWQIAYGHADEEGTFHIVVPHPGRYIIVASGQTGYEVAFWETQGVVINSGVTTTIKMSKPEEACRPITD
jgi:hypothetical protein